MRRVVDVDILIIGGGIQGLLLLRDFLRLGYSCVLLSNMKLYKSQTLCSQGYLHKGYFYQEAELVDNLSESICLWKSILSHLKINGLQDKSLYGIHKYNSKIWEQIWENNQLKYKAFESNIPAVFQHGIINNMTLYETDEICINTEHLLKKLYERFSEFIIDISAIESIDIQSNRISHIKFKSGAICGLVYLRYAIFTGGSGNADLVRAINRSSQEDTQVFSDLSSKVQQNRSCQVLLMKGSALPRISFLCPDIELFIAPRICGEETIWLVTHGFDTPICQDISPRNRWEFNRLRLMKYVNLINKIIPGIENLNLQYGVYTATKAESVLLGQGKRPNTFFADDLGFDNLVVIYPTKLTLAPLVSRKVSSILLENLKPSHTQVSDYVGKFGYLKNSNIAEEWKSVEWLNWRDILRYPISHRSEIKSIALL